MPPPRRAAVKTVPVTLNIAIDLKLWLYEEAERRGIVPARCVEIAIEAWQCELARAIAK